MHPATVSALLAAVARLWRLAGDAEITLEANPTSTEAARFAGFAAAEEHRRNLPAGAPVRSMLQRPEQRRLPALLVDRRSDMAVEITVGTFGEAEWPVDVQRPLVGRVAAARRC
jgi:oxygen-independent coproporphyrinogen-3 oxidase